MTEPTETIDPARLDRVRKLLAKAENAGTPEEAEIYTAKAVELISRHGLEDALAAAEGKAKDTIGQRRIYFDDPYSQAKAYLLGWIASALGAKWVLHGAYRGKVNSVTIFGFNSDLERAELFYTSLLLQASAQVANLQPTRDDEFNAWLDGKSRPSVRAIRRSWFLAFASTASNRLRAAQQAAVVEKDAEAPSGTPGAALVLVSRQEQVEKAYDETFTNLRKGKKVSYGYNSGTVRGVEAGRKADIGGKRVGQTQRTAINR